MRNSRRLPVFLCFVAAGVAAVLIYSCIPPSSFRAVKEPRSGAALAEHVAIVYSKYYQIDLAGMEKLHPFDINKYAKIYLQMNMDGLIQPEDVYVPGEISKEDILLVHTEGYLQDLKNSKKVAQYLEAGFVSLAPPKLLDLSILRAFRYAAGGTLLASRLALEYGIAVNLGGGYHHAEPGRGGGFCIYADMPIAIRRLQKEGLIKRALVIDLDVHQGNGTAEYFKGDDSVFTFSMHEGDIYPFPKADSDMDIELEAGDGDDIFIETLGVYLPVVFDRARPDLVFYQAGVDPLAEDPLANLEMTPGGIARRDEMVIDACVRRGVPVVMCLGGGYSENAWKVQYGSIRNIIEKYGLVGAERRHPSRPPSLKEKLYTK